MDKPFIQKGEAIVCQGWHLIAQANKDIFKGFIVNSGDFEWFITKPKEGEIFSPCPRCNTDYIRYRYAYGVHIHVAGKGWV